MHGDLDFTAYDDDEVLLTAKAGDLGVIELALLALSKELFKVLSKDCEYFNKSIATRPKHAKRTSVIRSIETALAES